MSHDTDDGIWPKSGTTKITGDLMLNYADEVDKLQFKYRRRILGRVMDYIVFKYLPDGGKSYQLDKDHSDAIAMLEWRVEYIHHFVQGF